jgi:hypothetical protein
MKSPHWRWRTDFLLSCLAKATRYGADTWRQYWPKETSLDHQRFVEASGGEQGDVWTMGFYKIICAKIVRTFALEKIPQPGEFNNMLRRQNRAN